MIIRAYIKPILIWFGLVALAYGFLALTNGAAGLVALLVAILSFPILVAGYERDRIPLGRWWVASLFALFVSIAGFAASPFYILSKI